MNMDYMSQFMGPGLGGIMAGTEQRQKEDQAFASTQKTLQDIVASQGQEQERAALLPGKLAQESDRAAMAPLARAEAQGRIDAATAKARAETMNDYIDEQIKTGDMPGGQETIMQDPRFKGMQNHPISKRAQEILILGRTDPEAAKKQWEEMKEKISSSAKSIEQRQREKAISERNREDNATSERNAQLRSDTQIALKEKDAEIREQDRAARQAIAEGKLSREKVGEAQVRLSQAVSDATGMPLGPQRDAAISKAKRDLAALTDSLTTVASARTWAQAEAGAQTLAQFGVKVDPSAFQRGGGGGAAAPAPAAAGGTRTTAGGNVVREIGQPQAAAPGMRTADAPPGVVPGVNAQVLAAVTPGIPNRPGQSPLAPQPTDAIGAQGRAVLNSQPGLEVNPNGNAALSTAGVPPQGTINNPQALADWVRANPDQGVPVPYGGQPPAGAAPMQGPPRGGMGGEMQQLQMAAQQLQQEFQQAQQAVVMMSRQGVPPNSPEYQQAQMAAQKIFQRLQAIQSALGGGPAGEISREQQLARQGQQRLPQGMQALQYRE